ncbi:hypothetical protein VTN00DRAFT_9875 [Thermoascus crustaceus]|uniref:uncharacterized protein n=1 Tax=Thermoascus crustaceus TaxID=5088 RepID=UPI003742157E
MDPYPSPQDGSPPFQKYQQYAPPMGYKQRKQKHPSFQKRNIHNEQSYSENIEYTESPRRHSEPQSCYNCGSPEHWAQDCPEPRRAVPAGADPNPRPLKRQKTGASIASRHSIPPYFKQRRPHHGNTYLPAGQSNYQPYSNYPPTPMSSHSQGVSPWQQSPQYTSPVQPYPPYGPHGLPTPTTANSSQFPSPASPHGGPHYQGYFPPQQSQFSFNQSPLQSYPEYSQYPPQRGQSQNSWRQQRYRDDVPSIAPPVEPWMEELQSLDNQTGSKSSGGQIVWRPANPVARPLPSTFTAREEVVSLPPLGSLQPGMSVSKYILDKGPEEFECHIRDTEEWPFVMDDPVFLEIATDCELISIEELVSRRKQTFETHSLRVLDETEEGEVDEGADNLEEQSAGKQSVRDDLVEREDENPQSGHEMTVSTGEIEHGLREMDKEDDVSDYLRTEEGFAEYCRKRPWSPDANSGYGHRNRSLSPGGRDSKSTQPGGKRNDRHVHHDRQAFDDRHVRRADQNTSSSNKESGPWKRRNGPHNHFDRDRRIPRLYQETGSNCQPYNRKRPRNFDGAHDTSPSRDSALAVGDEKTRSPEHLSNGHRDENAKRTLSPTQPRSERGDRKRPRPKDSPESDNDGPRRQEDDVPSKNKRRQLQVAAAYR